MKKKVLLFSPKSPLKISKVATPAGKSSVLLLCRGFFLIYISHKVPDGYILPEGRWWPTIVVEVGYTEKYEDLLKDASMLLEGSCGRIECVLLIKLFPLARNARGFVEVWTYDKLSKKKVKLGRKV